MKGKSGNEVEEDILWTCVHVLFKKNKSYVIRFTCRAKYTSFLSVGMWISMWVTTFALAKKMPAAGFPSYLLRWLYVAPKQNAFGSREGGGQDRNGEPADGKSL